MRVLQKSLVCVMAGLLGGCVVEVVAPQPRVVVAAPAPAVVVAAPAPGVVVAADAPLVVDGAVVVELEPPPVERVYIYDPGFPPGVYIWGGNYYFGGFYYPHDVFIHGFVDINIRGGRYMNIEDNRRRGHDIEARHREEFARNGGHVDQKELVKHRQNLDNARSGKTSGRPDAHGTTPNTGGRHDAPAPTDTHGDRHDERQPH